MVRIWRSFTARSRRELSRSLGGTGYWCNLATAIMPRALRSHACTHEFQVHTRAHTKHAPTPQVIFRMRLNSKQYLYAIVHCLTKATRKKDAYKAGLDSPIFFPSARFPDKRRYVIPVTSIKARALVFGDVDDDSLYWVVPEMCDWPDCLASTQNAKWP